MTFINYASASSNILLEMSKYLSLEICAKILKNYMKNNNRELSHDSLIQGFSNQIIV